MLDVVKSLVDRVRLKAEEPERYGCEFSKEEIDAASPVDLEEEQA